MIFFAHTVAADSGKILQLENDFETEFRMDLLKRFIGRSIKLNRIRDFFHAKEDLVSAFH